MNTEWRVEHESDTYPDGDGGSTYAEWWNVLDGKRAFRFDYQDDAEMVAVALNGMNDAARMRWLSPRMLAADFDYGGDGTQALVFEMPPGFVASADCGATIDAAMLTNPAVGAA